MWRGLVISIGALFAVVGSMWADSGLLDSRAGSTQSVSCPGDFNRNGAVDLSDFLAFAGAFGTRSGDANFDARMDLDGSGAIDLSDFLAFVGVFGKPCPPQTSPPVSIPDANLRAVIEDSLGKARGAPITRAEMAALSSLQAPGSRIRDLTGLEHAINLTVLNLDGNSISDVSPLFSLGNLRTLLLQNNQLGGAIPKELSNLSNLEALWLGGNRFSGDIPAELGNLSRLGLLGLEDNELSGTIPPALGRLSNLGLLNLGNNRLSGAIPGELGSLSNLEVLDISRNAGLSGPLPGSFTGLGSLTQLHLGGTGLCAPVDAAFQTWLQGVRNKRGVVNCGDTPAADRAALAALYNATNGTGWKENKNWLMNDLPLQAWAGVSTDAEGRVTGLDLSYNNLVGPIPSELGSLSQLSDLALDNNKLTGAVPPELGSLAELRVLDLSNNRLTDAIPGSFLGLKRLEQFYVSTNNGLCAPATDAFTSWLVSVRFNGPRCAAADDRAALVALYNATDGANWTNSDYWLTENPLRDWHGVTTDDAGRVVGLDLLENNLTGPIPSGVGNLTYLATLILGRNNLSGSIPAELGNLHSLGTLALYQNNLTGPIPPELGNLASLGDLNLWGNNLSGSIPPELGNLVGLWQLSLSANNLKGPIPAELEELGDALVVLDLQHTNLTGPIPKWIGNLANLARLSLAGNALTGSIPSEIGKLARLQSLDLSRNDLTGQVPRWIGDLANLESLDLSENGFTGTLPTEIGDLNRLKHLRLGGTALTGAIPSSITALKGIVTFSFQNTELCVSIPSWLASIPNVESSGRTCAPTERDILVALFNLTGGSSRWANKNNWLTDERLHLWEGVTTDSDGRIAYIDLSDNGLRGTIPPELGRLPNLIALNLSDNPWLQGPIPIETGSFPKLQTLDLSGNSLTGPIPPEIGSLAELGSLDLSGNPLRGPIPPEIGNLAELRSLDVSRSFVTGTLPPEIGNLNKLFSLRLNATQLAGALPATMTAMAGLTEFRFDVTRLCVTPPVQVWLESLPVHVRRRITTSGLTCPASDRDILVAFYNATGGPDWRNKTGWTDVGTPLDDWDGVSTDSDGRVTLLRLRGNLLSGEIPRPLWTLPNLVELDLGENGNLTGSIPPEIGNLQNLASLRLDGTGLSGAIPPEIGKLRNLVELRLINVPRLSGTIPAEFGNLRKLKWLNLDFNTNLVGEIPSEIGNLTELLTLGLQYAGLTGTIPSSIGNLTKLARLDLSNTGLTGSIPSEMGNLVDLEYLDLSNTSIWGSIPVALTALQRLSTFDFSDTDICVNHILEHRRLILPWLQSIPVPFVTASKRCANNILLAQGLHKLDEGNSSSALAPVPLIERDSTMLRVFVTNDLQDGEDYTWPEARARFYNPGNPSPVYSVRLIAGSLANGTSGGFLPDSRTVSELGGNLVGDLQRSLNGWVPEWVMWPGVEIEVEIDPEGKGHSRFRDRVRATVPLVSIDSVTVTVVPFIWRRDPEKYKRTLLAIGKSGEEPRLSNQFGFMRDVLPISDAKFSVRVREPLWTDVEPNTNIKNASKLLRELELAWAIDSGLHGNLGILKGIERDPMGPGLNFYQGWIFPSTLFGPKSGELGGLARRNGLVSVSLNDPHSRAHEVGHNFGLRHAPAPCSPTISGVDPHYPDPAGRIDTWGYGAVAGTFLTPPIEMIAPSKTLDFMSYCPPYWTSEYHFRKALAGAGAVAIAASVQAQSPSPRESLLLWGGVDTQGSLTLDPSFYLNLPSSVPQTDGPYQLAGQTAAGVELFSLRFEMPTDACGGGTKSFLFALPAEPRWANALATITLSGPEGHASIDQDGELIMSLLFEETSGKLRGVLRDQAAEPEAASKSALVEPGLRVLVSRGVPERTSVPRR